MEGAAFAMATWEILLTSHQFIQNPQIIYCLHKTDLLGKLLLVSCFFFFSFFLQQTPSDTI